MPTSPAGLSPPAGAGVGRPPGVGLGAGPLGHLVSSLAERGRASLGRAGRVPGWRPPRSAARPVITRSLRPPGACVPAALTRPGGLSGIMNSTGLLAQEGKAGFAAAGRGGCTPARCGRVPDTAEPRAWGSPSLRCVACGGGRGHQLSARARLGAKRFPCAGLVKRHRGPPSWGPLSSPFYSGRK